MALADSIDHVQREFLAELRKLHAKMDWPRYKHTKLTLQLSYSDDNPRIELTWSGEYGEAPVKGTDLVAVMAEVYRRLGYDDRAEAAIQTTLRQLTPPTVD